jgi:hypothetical protein
MSEAAIIAAGRRGSLVQPQGRLARCVRRDGDDATLGPNDERIIRGTPVRDDGGHREAR